MNTAVLWQAPEARAPADSPVSLLTSVAASLLACAPAVYGAEAPHVEVRHEDSRYQVHMEAVIHAPPGAVVGLLTDYEQLGRINPAIKESQVIATIEPGSHRVRTLIELCVWIFCAEIKQIQDMQRTAEGELHAIIVPQGSDFKRGWARWQFFDEGGVTRLVFASELEPDFVIPPLIGPWVIRRMLRREALITIAGLERLVRPAGQR